MGQQKNLKTVQASSKLYKCAPLPFQGQKRFFTTQFTEALREIGQKQEIKLIIDLFGGSGLLAHTAKSIFPDCRVIFNDYDDYHIRLLNVEKTNRLLADIRAILGKYEKGARLDAADRTLTLQRIEKEARTGYVDYITISSSLVFSGRFATSLEQLSKESTFYNSVRKCDYDVNAGDYLAGLEIYKCDYKPLFEKYKDIPGVVFLVDPPYLTTDTKTYHSDQYWKLKDYLDVLKVLKGTSYVYFTSNKSSLVELCQWFEDNLALENPFSGADMKTHLNRINKDASYSDMMLYKLCG